MAKELKKVRNVKPLWSRLGTMAGVMLGGIDMWLNTIFPFLPHTLKHAKADYAGLSKASSAQPIEYDKPDGKLTFDILSSVFLSGTNHEEDQPVHLRLTDPSIPIEHNLPDYAEPAQRYCPAQVYEVVAEGETGEVPDQRSELRPLQDLRREGSGAEHHLGPARRRRRAELRQYVSST